MFHVEQALFVEALVKVTPRFGILLNDEQISSFAIYYRELDRWNRRINLTALRDPKGIAIKHFLDSLLFSQALEPQSSRSLLDIGSGPGFPGLPLKILKPELVVTLLEPNEKKTAFLRHVIGTLGLQSVSVVSMPLREFSRTERHARRFSSITVRAVALSRVLPFAAGLLEKGGRLLVCLGKALDSDPRAHGFTVARTFDYELPNGFGHRVLTVLEPVNKL